MSVRLSRRINVRRSASGDGTSPCSFRRVSTKASTGLWAHDVAHQDLGVALNLWQTVYAYSVIVAGPFVAAAFVLAGRSALGYSLLGAAMFGALVFGGVHHYVLISPDHVAHLPAGDAQPLFRQTAAAMLVVEALGTALGVVGWRRAKT